MRYWHDWTAPAAARRWWHKVARRVYSACTPNTSVHIDGKQCALISIFEKYLPTFIFSHLKNLHFNSWLNWWIFLSDDLPQLHHWQSCHNTAVSLLTKNTLPLYNQEDLFTTAECNFRIKEVSGFGVMYSFACCSIFTFCSTHIEVLNPNNDAQILVLH